MTQQITLVKDKILSDNYFTLHKFTIAVMVRRSSCTTRRKRAWF